MFVCMILNWPWLLIPIQVKWWNFAFQNLKQDSIQTLEQYMVLARAQVPKFLKRDDVRTLSIQSEFHLLMFPPISLQQLFGVAG